MKRINRYAVFLFLMMLAVMSCEIDLTLKQQDLPADISVFGIMSPDTSMQIMVSKTHLYFITLGEQMGEESLLPDADVRIIVNGKESTAVYDAAVRRFISDSRARPLDHVEVSVESDGLRSTYCEFQVPAEPKMEILSIEKVFDDIENGDVSSSFQTYDSDTLAVITVKITDLPGDNYYRLKVRSEGFSDSALKVVQNRFTSGDIVFYDERLYRETSALPAYFSNIFDDRYFDGKEYTFKIESRIQANYFPFKDFSEKRIVVELQALSKGLYDYLKAVEIYDRAYEETEHRDEYMEGVVVPTNMVNGTGAVGAYIRKQSLVEL